MLKHHLYAAASLSALMACDSTLTEAPQQETLSSIMARPVAVASYPTAGRTYLSFSQAHGFQVNYLGTGGRAWLWYPGNRSGVPELWRVKDGTSICFSHPTNTYNPVTKQRGGSEQCSPLDLSRKLTISVLSGDPYNLSSGQVPYRLRKCEAPEAFDFDRERYACG